jgi:hypothetical protein
MHINKALLALALGLALASLQQEDTAEEEAADGKPSPPDPPPAEDLSTPVLPP